MRVAITGGVAEGKSTVCQVLRDLGRSTVSSDEIARAVFAEEDVQRALAGLLGSSPPIDRSVLREAITNSPETRQYVNQLMHPRIRQQMDASSAQFHEVPLLFETCLQSRYDRIWVVSCGEAEQLRRLTLRLGNQAAAQNLIATQLPTTVKAAFADAVVDTRCDLETVKFAVAELVHRLPSS